MKTKLIALVFGAVIGSGVVSAQSNDCATMAALAYDDAKAKDYEAAYEPLMKVRKECPKYSLATFQYGERALKYKIDNSEGEEQKEYIEELIELWEERLELFPEKSSKGKIYGDIAQLRFDYKIGDKEEQYEAFDRAFTEDPDNFTSPKGIYAYFSLLVDMQDAGDRSLEDVFAKYDEVIAKVESEENELAERLAPLLEKQEQAETLTAKEKTLVKNSEINLKAYNQVKNAINGKLGQRADCDNLIPLYTKDFEEKKTDVDWLKNANARLSAKDCTEDPLFVKVSEALHKLEPSAKSAFSLGQLAEANGDRSKALEYYNEAAELEDDNNAKSRIYYRIANNYKDRGSFSQARTYYRRALDARPSLGSAYLQIANMYANSANDCGNTTFEKRAVYWAAADYARRAASVDPSIASNANQAASSYMGRAPQKSDVFQEGRSAGEAIQIGCWIGETVRIPNL
ncbi:hypothetical protein [Salegentibacter sp.]|uniref:hypothetical protein n=1 Tax=Salegentibacter sp. TaxID=1903072 RepID=UPI00356890EF